MGSKCGQGFASTLPESDPERTLGAKGLGSPNTSVIGSNCGGDVDCNGELGYAERVDDYQHDKLLQPMAKDSCELIYVPLVTINEFTELVLRDSIFLQYLEVTN